MSVQQTTLGLIWIICFQLCKQIIKQQLQETHSMCEYANYVQGNLISLTDRLRCKIIRAIRGWALRHRSAILLLCRSEWAIKWQHCIADVFWVGGAAASFSFGACPARRNIAVCVCEDRGSGNFSFCAGLILRQEGKIQESLEQFQVSVCGPFFWRNNFWRIFIF